MGSYETGDDLHGLPILKLSRHRERHYNVVVDQNDNQRGLIGDHRKHHEKIREMRIKLDKEVAEGEDIGKATLSLQQRSSSFIVRGSSIRSTTSLLSMPSIRDRGSSRKKQVNVNVVQRPKQQTIPIAELRFGVNDVDNAMQGAQIDGTNIPYESLKAVYSGCLTGVKMKAISSTRIDHIQIPFRKYELKEFVTQLFLSSFLFRFVETK